MDDSAGSLVIVRTRVQSDAERSAMLAAQTSAEITPDGDHRLPRSVRTLVTLFSDLHTQQLHLFAK